jgi:DNA-binding transcriptional regulator YiaG
MAKRSGSTLGGRLLQSAREAARIERGELRPASISRHLTAATADVEPPPTYDAETIRGIRGQMELSQPLFAAALNVSPETVRAWEQGKREPDGPTLRLLEVAEHHPEVFLRKLHIRRASKGPRVTVG